MKIVDNHIIHDGSSVRYYQDYTAEYVGNEYVMTNLNRWIVTGPTGFISKHTKESKAAQAADEWADYYDEHQFKVPLSQREINLLKRR